MISSKPVFLPSARSILNISQCTSFGGNVVRQGVPAGGNAGTEIKLPSSKLKVPLNTLSNRLGRSYNASSVTVAGRSQLNLIQAPPISARATHSFVSTTPSATPPPRRSSDSSADETVTVARGAMLCIVLFESCDSGILELGW